MLSLKSLHQSLKQSARRLARADVDLLFLVCLIVLLTYVQTRK